MSNLVFVSGDFCSGSTLLFTLFRATGEYRCLYEPLHERLPEYLIWPLRVYDHHDFVEDYFTEFKGYRSASRLFDPRWGTSGLHVGADEPADDLYRYLSYLIGESFARSPKVMLKDNRFQFRLEWLKARFPSAKVVHIHRPKEGQWGSMVRRGQAALGRMDIGQDSVHFQGFNLATWCEDLKHLHPELAADCSRTGFERFSKLWDASFAAQSRSADISIDFTDLIGDYEATSERLRAAVGCDFDLASLRHLVVADRHQNDARRRLLPAVRGRELIDRLGRHYARMRVRA